jgi:excisionase family DNA binding protein
MQSSALREHDEMQDVAQNRKPPASEGRPYVENRSFPSPPAETTSVFPREDVASRSFNAIEFPSQKAVQERLLNAREVAARLGVSERWVRDHTTRRSPKLRGVKLGTLMRYRSADVEEFVEKLATSRPFLQARYGG